MNDETIARRIHWLGRQPTPYNDFLFSHLAQDSKIDLTVHYRSRRLSSHPWRSKLGQGYRARYYKTFLSVDWHLLSIIFKDRTAFFFIAGWDHPTSQILLTVLRIFKLRYALWTDTPDIDRARPLLVSYLRAIWLRWIFSGAARVLATGEPGVRCLSLMGAPRERLVNFPFFLDLNAFARDAISRKYDADRPLRLVSSGRIDNRLKGHDIAVRALALAARNGGVPFEYCIAGTGPDECKLTELVSMLGLEGKVRCLGWMEPDALRLLYLSSDVLIHPSPVHDPFPNAVLEGMAAGLVVLGSDVSGSALDRIQNGINGFIHHAGDMGTLSEQIRSLLQNPESIPELGNRARQTAAEWPIERAVATIREIIQPQQGST